MTFTSINMNYNDMNDIEYRHTSNYLRENTLNTYCFCEFDNYYLILCMWLYKHQAAELFSEQSTCRCKNSISTLGNKDQWSSIFASHTVLSLILCIRDTPLRSWYTVSTLLFLEFFHDYWSFRWWLAMAKALLDIVCLWLHLLHVSFQSCWYLEMLRRILDRLVSWTITSLPTWTV